MSVAVHVEGRVRIVTITRPDRRNAVDGPTALALAEAILEADDEPSVDVIVITGAGGNFCAGADLHAMTTERANTVSPDIAELGPMGPTRLRTAKPVIAAVEGYAVAGGLELACWADLRVVARDATFGVFCRRWGVPLIDGGTVRLARIVGHARAMDMLLTGRAVDAEEAFSWGLASRVCAPGDALSEAVRLGEQISAHPQTCVRSDRASLLDQWSLDESEALKVEFAHGLRALQAPEFSSGIASFQAGDGRSGAARP
ncbi:MAG: crotonase/enoyl-CoA hydratase family protein [Actinobacteria bacterium]|nr:crotonase/enoyl-CoA hydratase family protein [Actinomycetota bacterium]MCB9389312.1 crotonase/enoyl-CoA hydratase family protein [Acidimicrobiia bacterium]